MVISGLEEAEPGVRRSQCPLPPQAPLPDLLLSNLHYLIAQQDSKAPPEQLPCQSPAPITARPCDITSQPSLDPISARMGLRCNSHPMPEFGSFCLLLALILTVYTFLVGSLSLWGASATGQRLTRIPDAAWNRLGETARRAGIASFIVLCCAAFALVWAAFTNDFSVAYILAPHQPRPQPRLQVRRALVRPGRLAAALGVAALRLRLRPAPAPPRRSSASPPSPPPSSPPSRSSSFCC